MRKSLELKLKLANDLFHVVDINKPKINNRTFDTLKLMLWMKCDLLQSRLVKEFGVKKL